MPTTKNWNELLEAQLTTTNEMFNHNVLLMKLEHIHQESMGGYNQILWTQYQPTHCYHRHIEDLHYPLDFWVCLDTKIQQ